MSESDARTPPTDLAQLLDGDLTLIAPLIAEGVLTVDDLCAKTAKEVRFTDGIGPKRFGRIEAAVIAAGRSLQPEPAETRKEPDRPGTRSLTDRWCKAFEASTKTAYRWTPSGRNSDQSAARVLYDAVGWSEEPPESVVADAGGAVRRYLGWCRDTGRTPTLTDLVAGLSRWRQDLPVNGHSGPGPPRNGHANGKRSLFEQLRDDTPEPTPTLILIDPETGDRQW